jgi:hypothetical protein
LLFAAKSPAKLALPVSLPGGGLRVIG